MGKTIYYVETKQSETPRRISADNDAEAIEKMKTYFANPVCLYIEPSKGEFKTIWSSMSKKKQKCKKRKKNHKAREIEVVDPNLLKSRDEAIVSLINGAYKSGFQVDKRKEDDKKKCRQKIRPEDNK